jgi:hypothetical protein
LDAFNFEFTLTDSRLPLGFLDPCQFSSGSGPVDKPAEAFFPTTRFCSRALSDDTFQKQQIRGRELWGEKDGKHAMAAHDTASSASLIPPENKHSSLAGRRCMTQGNMQEIQ